jgi:hypothetical protein
MKLEEFKSGIYKTQLRNQSNCQYKSFYPTMLNQDWIWSDNRINVLLEEASISIAELNAFSSLIPNVNLFISMHINKEATYSTKIEGTKTELEDLFVNNNLNEEEKNDKKEVENYIKALNFAVNKLEEIPICNRLLKETEKLIDQISKNSIQLQKDKNAGYKDTAEGLEARIQQQIKQVSDNITSLKSISSAKAAVDQINSYRLDKAQKTQIEIARINDKANKNTGVKTVDEQDKFLKQYKDTLTQIKAITKSLAKESNGAMSAEKVFKLDKAYKELDFLLRAPSSVL